MYSSYNDCDGSHNVVVLSLVNNHQFLMIFCSSFITKALTCQTCQSTTYGSFGNQRSRRNSFVDCFVGLNKKEWKFSDEVK